MPPAVLQQTGRRCGILRADYFSNPSEAVRTLGKAFAGWLALVGLPFRKRSQGASEGSGGPCARKLLNQMPFFFLRFSELSQAQQQLP
jgi:hypothetical protein